MAGSRKTTLKTVKDLLDGQFLAVLATATGTRPHASLVGFAADCALGKIYFATPVGSRKYRNMLENPRVSLLFDSRANRPGDFTNARAVTVHGTAKILSGSARAAAGAFLLEKLPALRGFVDDPASALVEVSVSSCLVVERFRETFGADV